MRNRIGALLVVGAAAALVTVAWSGHELPIYPSFYPHEIEIRTLPPIRPPRRCGRARSRRMSALGRSSKTRRPTGSGRSHRSAHSWSCASIRDRRWRPTKGRPAPRSGPWLARRAKPAASSCIPIRSRRSTATIFTTPTARPKPGASLFDGDAGGSRVEDQGAGEAAASGLEHGRDRLGCRSDRSRCRSISGVRKPSR